MKKLITTKPLLATTIVFVALFAIVVGLSTVIFMDYANHIKAAFVLLTIWYLYRLEGKNLSELGLTRRSLRLLPIGLLIGIVYFTVFFGLQMWYNHISFSLNDNINWRMIFNGLLFLSGSVMIEEFIFRGYCFQKTFQQIGIVKANIIFACLFIVYHWFALNAWGDSGAMLSLITTGFGHVLFATAFTQSRSLFLPIGIHLGNNWAQRYLFSVKTMGLGKTTYGNDSVFAIQVPEQQLSSIHTFGSYLLTFLCFLGATYLIWKWYNRD